MNNYAPHYSRPTVPCEYLINPLLQYCRFLEFPPRSSESSRTVPNLKSKRSSETATAAEQFRSKFTGSDQRPNFEFKIRTEAAKSQVQAHQNRKPNLKFKNQNRMPSQINQNIDKTRRGKERKKEIMKRLKKLKNIDGCNG